MLLLKLHKLVVHDCWCDFCHLYDLVLLHDTLALVESLDGRDLASGLKQVSCSWLLSIRVSLVDQ